MNLLNLGNVGGAAMVLAAMVVNGCGSSPAPAAEAFIDGEVVAGNIPGVNDVGACGSTVPDVFALGNATHPKPVTNPDGKPQNGGSVSVSCSVQQSGSGFNIQLAATLGGQNGGALFVTGSVDNSGSGMHVTGTFTAAGQTYLDHECTITPTYGGSDLPSYGKPASGKIWGHLECPQGTISGQFGQGIDGGPVPKACDVNVDFMFINCG